MSGSTKSIIPEHFRDRPFLNKPFPRRKLLETLREITTAPPMERRDSRGHSLERTEGQQGGQSMQYSTFGDQEPDGTSSGLKRSSEKFGGNPPLPVS